MLLYISLFISSYLRSCSPFANQLADINGWPKFKHLLAPRTKGLVVAVNTLRNHIDCVYDLTVGYPNNGIDFVLSHLMR